MRTYFTSLGWAALIMLATLAARLSGLGENMANMMVSAVLGMWVSTSFPRNCAGRIARAS